MDKNKLKKILEDFKTNKISEEDVFTALKKLPFEDLSFAKLDTHRSIRTGFPEVIYCQGKSLNHIVEIFKHMIEHNQNILLTRANDEIFTKLKEIEKKLQYYPLSKIIVLERKPLKKRNGILIIAAGTADIPVAQEAELTASIMGNKVKKIYDVGVAGLPRLLAHLDDIYSAKCIIAIAGMDGACVPTVAGLANCPVIAVPTSVGYGASFNGLAPLLTMLNCCAPGVSVVNIDNGFGAGYFAALVNKNGEKK